jgi:hypothetical protein
LVPIIEEIAKTAGSRHDEDWIKRRQLKIYTNNLEGATAFMKFGRASERDSYAELLLDVHILPGIPLATFNAVAGDETEAALRNLRRKYPETYIIALLTGNWVTLESESREDSRPVPLARGDKHLSFKKELVNQADEIYIVAPLGKMFLLDRRNERGLVEEAVDQLNRVSELSPTAKNSVRESYGKIEIKGDKVNVTKLVTTSRPDYDEKRYVLSNLSQQLMGILNKTKAGLVRQISEREFSSKEASELPHIAFAFPDVAGFSNSIRQEIIIEFPHEKTRTPAILTEYFKVPAATANKYSF